MPLKVAIWCPHGRERLPLAARLMLQQFPPELVAWSGDVAKPPEPVLACDLWLVMCVGVPPTPPSWHETASSVWAVFPGSVNDWTAETGAILDAWRPCHVLVDLLPDEVRSDYMNAASGQQDVTWLPSLGGVLTMSSETQGFHVEYDGEPTARLWGAFMEAFGCSAGVVGNGHRGSPSGPGLRLPERIAICSRDPVFTCSAVRDAYSRGIRPLVVGSVGSPMRRALLCEELTGDVAEPDGKQGIRDIWSALSAAAQDPARRDTRIEPAALCWQEWAECLLDPERPPRGIGGKAARVMRETQAHEMSPSVLARRAFAAGAGIELGLGVHHPATQSPAVFARLVRCVPGNGLYALLGHLAESDAAWITAAARWAIRSDNIPWAMRLWTGVCDEFVTVDTAATVRALAQVFEGSFRAGASTADMCRVRAAILASVGRFELASADLSRLCERDGCSGVAAMMTILRAWLPAIKQATTEVIPARAREWWMEQMGLFEAKHREESWLVSVFGEIWIGSMDEAARRLEEKPMGIAEASWVAIILWIQQNPALGSAVWTRFRGAPLPAQPEQRLPALCAKALYEPNDEQLRLAHQNLVKEHPAMFARLWPSQLNCYLSYLISRHFDDTEATRRWREISRVNEPLGRVLLRAEPLAE